MKTNVIIIHGTRGNPDENWFPWLKAELEKRDCEVFVPAFPTPRGQSLDNWCAVFAEYETYLNEDAILVGHSLGPVFLLSVLEDLTHPVKAAFFVGGFVGFLGHEQFDELNKTFVDRSFEWQKIRKNCKNFYVINALDDPYVPVESGKELAENLDAELVVLPEGGHLNEEFGFTEFELLRDLIVKEI